jgi:hypothetical protein
MPSSANVETGGRHDSSYYERHLLVIAHRHSFGKHFVVARLGVEPANDICRVGAIANASNSV